MGVAADAEVAVHELVPGSARLGCLIVHGLTGTPHEMAPVAAALAGRYPLWLARVAGHDTRVEDLAATTWRDWYESAAEGARALLAVTPRIAVVGLSMGALLALRLAVELPRRVAGVALLSPAMATRRVPPWLRAPLGVVGVLDQRIGLVRAAVSRVVLTKGLSDIADDVVRGGHPGYRHVPFRALLQLLALQRIALADAPKVTQPALVVHATQDHTAPIAAARLLFDRLGSTEKRLVVLDDSYHVVTVDRERERVLAEVTAFVDRLASAEASDTSGTA